MQSEAFAQALRRAVLAQRLHTTPDAWAGGAAVQAHPSIDLAVVAFGPGPASAVAANVLFSREHPQGWVAGIAPDAGALAGVRFDADLQDAQGQSVAWAPGSDWAALPWRAIAGPGAANASNDRPRFVAPYPASLLKLMVAVGLCLAVDRGQLAWADVEPLLTPMIIVSSNEATDECVALLHRTGLLGLSGGRGPGLNDVFARHGLPTLQMHDTTARGG